jgi:2,3-bisphosphoglycerate-independent phosphoglycerate mutase
LLNKHPFNKGRVCPANFLLMRGFGSHIPKLQPFKEKYGLRACGLTSLNVNKGILKLCGMDIIETPEGIGGGEKELEAKRAPLEKAMKLYNFIFVHIKNADTPGHDGNVTGKVKELELIDKFIGSLDLTDRLVVVTSDHCTPCGLKGHSADPVPFVISPIAGANKQRIFGEHTCTDFKIRPYQLMDFVMKLGKIKK